MKRNIPTVIAAGVLVLILLAYMVTFQVRYTETVVVTTFGQPSEPIDGAKDAGVNWKLPWPIQRVIRFDNRLRIVEGAEEELRTRDEQNLVVLAYAGWKIKDPLKFLRSVRTAKEAERKLWRLLDTHKKTVVGHYRLEEFVSRDPKQIRIEQAEKEIETKLQQDASDQFGIEVTMVGIKRMSLPAATTEKVFDRMRAEQDNLVAEFRADGESEALKIISDAESSRERILAFADRMASEIRGEGELAAAQLIRQFDKDPEFAMFLKKLDYLKETLAKRTIYVLSMDDVGTEFFATDGMPARSRGDTGLPGPTPKAVTPTQAPPVDPPVARPDPTDRK